MLQMSSVGCPESSTSPVGTFIPDATIFIGNWPSLMVPYLGVKMRTSYPLRSSSLGKKWATWEDRNNTFRGLLVINVILTKLVQLVQFVQFGKFDRSGPEGNRTPYP